MVSFEILRRCLIVLSAIGCHSEHVEALLSVGGALHHRHDILKQEHGTVVLALGEALLGILVLILVVVGLVDPVELIGTS